MTPFEKACRALCALDGNSENIRVEGRPMWRSYAPQVEAVLLALKEPHPPMVNAAVKTANEIGVTHHTGIWQAMLHAIDE